MSRSCTSRLSRRSRTRSKSRGSRRGRMTMSARSAAAAIGEPRQARQRQDGRVRSDLGIEVAANPSERLVQLDGVQIATAFVEHVARDRREPGPLARIGGRADRQQHQQADERHGVVLDGPHAAGRCQASGGGFRETGTPGRGRAPEASSDRPPSGHRDRTRIAERQPDASLRDDAQRDAAVRPQPVARGSLHRFGVTCR